MRESFHLPILKSIFAVRRLVWITKMAREPSNSIQLRAVLFLPLLCDSRPQLDSRGYPQSFASEWLKQVALDYDRLRSLDLTLPLISSLPFGLETLFLPESPLIGKTKHFFRQLHIYMQPVADTNADAAFSWNCPLCEANFATRTALSCHARKKHLIQIVPGTRAVLTNQCPFCRKVFTTKNYTFEHVKRRKNNVCPTSTDRRVVQPGVREPLQISCPYCGQHCANLDLYYEHLGHCTETYGDYIIADRIGNET